MTLGQMALFMAGSDSMTGNNRPYNCAISRMAIAPSHMEFECRFYTHQDNTLECFITIYRS
jgi:hypothetical protein